MSELNNEPIRLPLLALRGLNVFPGMLLTFDVERSASLGALSAAEKRNQMIYLVSQRDLSVDLPEAPDLYDVGTVCRIRQMLRQPQSRMCRVMVEGLYRADTLSVNCDPKGYSATLRARPDREEKNGSARTEALLRSCVSLYQEYLQLNPEMPGEQILNVLANPNPAYVSDYLAQNVQLRLEDKQMLLEESAPSRRLALLVRLLNKELNVLSIEKELSEQTQDAMNRSQREYYLREEMKIIQSELGEDAFSDDSEELREKIAALEAPQEVKDKLKKELSRLLKQPFGSAEASVIRGYLDTCLELPWGKQGKETLDLAKARKILDDEHFGLEKVKERILEYLAVKQLSPEIKGGLLCLVGPPGTGKTSIAMSVAHATGESWYG